MLINADTLDEGPGIENFQEALRLFPPFRDDDGFMLGAVEAKCPDCEAVFSSAYVSRLGERVMGLILGQRRVRTALPDEVLSRECGGCLRDDEGSVCLSCGCGYMVDADCID